MTIYSCIFCCFSFNANLMPKYYWFEWVSKDIAFAQKICFFKQPQKNFVWRFSFKTQFKIEFLGLFTRTRNPQEKALHKKLCSLPAYGFDLKNRANSLVVSDLHSETKGSWFKSSWYLCTEVSSLQQLPS